MRATVVNDKEVLTIVAGFGKDVRVFVDLQVVGVLPVSRAVD